MEKAQIEIMPGRYQKLEGEQRAQIIKYLDERAIHKLIPNWYIASGQMLNYIMEIYGHDALMFDDELDYHIHPNFGVMELKKYRVYRYELEKNNVPDSLMIHSRSRSVA